MSNNIVRITELPIGIWTDDYKQYLENLLDKGSKGKKNDKKSHLLIKDYNDMSTDTNVDIYITFATGVIKNCLINNKIDENCNELEKLLKLYTSQTITNMHLFDAKEKLKKYNKIEDIIEDYYEV